MWAKHPPGGDFHLATGGDFGTAIDTSFFLPATGPYACCDIEESSKERSALTAGLA